MNNQYRLPCSALIALSLAYAGATFASGEQLHLRGEITSVSDNSLAIKARNGKMTTIQLPENLQIHDVSRTDLSAISENSYVGVAAAPAAGGKIKALGVMVFPEGARGLNEGHFPWDMQKKSTMTNATVVKLIRKRSGANAELEVRYGDKIQKIGIDPTTSIGQFVPGQRSLLVKGAKVVVFASTPDGASSPTAGIVMVGKDGFIPPL